MLVEEIPGRVLPETNVLIQSIQKNCGLVSGIGCGILFMWKKWLQRKP